MFNDKQIKILDNQLDSKRIKSRQKGNINLSYLEGFDIIETANKVFGYGAWSYSISNLEQVSQENNQNQNIVICYKAIISVIVYDSQHLNQIKREDVGFGTGIAKALADAHESGAKEAVTDAIKRSLRSFGNQFGNSLYDKSRNYPNKQEDANTQAKQVQNAVPQNYSSLYNLGLQVVEQGDNLIVMGDNIFSKKTTIKAEGFKWDGSSKLWYKRIQKQVA